MYKKETGKMSLGQTVSRGQGVSLVALGPNLV